MLAFSRKDMSSAFSQYRVQHNWRWRRKCAAKGGKRTARLWFESVMTMLLGLWAGGCGAATPVGIEVNKSI